jgi:hypothetical protein
LELRALGRAWALEGIVPKGSLKQKRNCSLIKREKMWKLVHNLSKNPDSQFFHKNELKFKFILFADLKCPP